MAEEKLPIITVVGAGTDGKVVLWERNEEHPPTLDKDGKDTGKPHEAFVSNDGKEREVAETAEVRRLLAEGLLVTPEDKRKAEVKAASRPEAPKVPATPPPTK